MPTFPIYPEELPSCLNLLKLRHYWLVAYWVYFRPSALYSYLYQTDREVYENGGEKFVNSFRIPQYRNLRFISLTIGFLGTGSILSLVLFLSLLLNAIKPRQVQFSTLLITMGFAVSLSLVIGLVAELLIGYFRNPAIGISSSTNALVSLGPSIASAYLTGFLLINVLEVDPYFSLLAASIFFFGILRSQIFVFLISLLVFGGSFILGVIIDPDSFFNISSNILGIAILSVFSVFYIILFSRFMCVFIFIRIPIYLYLTLAYLFSFLNTKHPVFWDEITLIPFLGWRNSVLRLWRSNEEHALYSMASSYPNSIKMCLFQDVMYKHLNNTRTPIHFLYLILSTPVLSGYITPPKRFLDWWILPSCRQAFLYSISKYKPSKMNRKKNRKAFFFVNLMPIRRSTKLTEFAGFLYQIAYLYEGDIDEVSISEKESSMMTRLGFEDEWLSSYLQSVQQLFEYLTRYPGGQEIQKSFGCMLTYLKLETLEEVVDSQAVLTDLPDYEYAIRPPVIRALQRFGNISREVAVFQASTSRVNQLAALGRATDALEELRSYIRDAVTPPEQEILQAIVRRWRKLVSNASGELGQLTIAAPIPNPYVAGNPVSGELFVGREEILRELEELWLQPGQTDSLLLYGHRRMGKSSILKNLPQRLDPQRNWVVEFNLQRVGKVRSTGELLYALALEMFDRLPPDENLPVAEPDEAAFLDQSRNPYQAFNRWLKQVGPHMGERRFIIAIDEFELLEVAIDDQRLEADLIEYLRGLINIIDWFVIALAGLYTLQEKTHDYWNPLFGSIKSRKVSFLSPPYTRKLLTQPSPDFPIDYTQDALDEVVRLTSGQPYLVQLIGQNLVAQFNHQVFEAGQDFDRPISLADLRAVIDSPEFFQDGGAYFTGVWRQAEDSDPPGQPEILTALSQQDCSIAELTTATGLNTEQVAAAIKTLEAHDVIHTTESGRYSFIVELMRRWVQRRQSS